MIRWIIETSLRFRFLIIALAIVLMIYGIIALQKMPIEVFPEFQPPIVEVQAEALGLSATEVESLVTLNIEEILTGTPWLESIQSESLPGLASIVMVFKPGTDILRARQFVQENLSRSYALPNISKPPVMLQTVSVTRRAMMVGLSSKKLSPMEISVLAQWTIRPKLMAVPGVANVVIWGQKNRQLQILIDPEQLVAHNLTQEQIIKTAGDALWFTRLSYLNASVPGTGGWIETPNQRLLIQHVFPISTAADLAKLPIANSNLRLGDVTKVIEGHQPLIGDILLDDAPGVILVIESFPNANTLDVTQGIDQALATLGTGLPGINIDTHVFRLADFINLSISNLDYALLISAILIAILLFIFLTDWRSAIIILITIPLSLLAAVIVLYLYGASINIMVLTGFAIALGAIVDDTVIDVENIVRRICLERAAGDHRSTFAIILDASIEVRKPILYATFIMILAVTPIFFINGLYGTFLRPLAWSYVLALVASMLVTFMVVPALCYLFFQKQQSLVCETRFRTWAKERFNDTLNRILGTPKIVYAIGGALIMLGVIIYFFLSYSLLPNFKERSIVIDLDGAPSMSQIEMRRILWHVNQQLQSIPGVDKVAALSGRALTSDKKVNVNSSQIWAVIKPNADYEKTLVSINQTVRNFPGLEYDIQGFLQSRINSALSGENEDIVVRINGPKWEILRTLADKIQHAFEKIHGLNDISVEGLENEPQIEIKVDLNKAAAYGIKPGDVRRAAATIFSGIEAGNIFEAQKVFEVVVWSIPKVRHSISDIQNLMIDKPGGGYVRLGDIAEVKVTSSPTVINHYGITPYIDIVANIKDGNISAINQEVEKVVKDINYPLEYHPQFLGEYAQGKTIKHHLIFSSLTALLVIIFLMQVILNSWRLTFISLLALPIAVVGSLIAIALNGGVISLGAEFGFLAVIGIAIRNTILLISHYNHLQYVEGVQFGTELIIRGTLERLGPILMTVLITIVAILPFIVMGPEPGLEILHPMAVVILGGILTSTFLILMIIPPLYLYMGATIKPDAEWLE